MSKRPTGITILATLVLLGGLMSLFFGGFEAVLGPMVQDEIYKQTSDAAAASTGGAMAIMGVGLFVIGLIQVITALGLFMLKGWAWIVAALMQVLSIIMNGLQAVNMQVPGSIVAVLVSAGILYYLFRPNVKTAFGRG